MGKLINLVPEAGEQAADMARRLGELAELAWPRIWTGDCTPPRMWTRSTTSIEGTGEPSDQEGEKQGQDQEE